MMSKRIQLGLVLLLLTGAFAIALSRAAAITVHKTELSAAVELYRSEGAAPALPEFERLQSLFRQSGDLLSEIQAEHFVGECHWRLGNYVIAREHLDHSLAGSRSFGQRLAEGKTLNVLGLLEWDQGHYEEAIANFNLASQIGSDLGDRRLAGLTMNNLSLVYDELGDYSTSLEQYERALELYEGADFPRGEGDTLGNIGGVHLLLGRYQEALSYYQRALEISQTLQSMTAMTLDHGNLGLAYLGLGQADTALKHFNLALSLAIDTGMRKEEALWLRGKGNALIQKGQYDLGLQNIRAALEIYQDVEARGVLIDALHDAGQIHLTLGDLVSAEQYFLQSAELAREIGLAQAITANQLALGDLQFRLAHFDQAEALYRQAMQRASEAGELNYQAESELRLSLAHRELNAFDLAEKESRRALTIAQEINARPVMAWAWFAMGELGRLQNKANSALEHYSNAQRVSGQDTDPDLLWRLHYAKAQVQTRLGDRQTAVTELEEAVRIIESVRQRLRQDRFRAGYIQDKSQVYIDLVRLQLELGLNQQAFVTAERLRAHSFLAQLENSGPILRNQEQAEREFALRERIRHLQNMLQEENEMPLPERRQKAVDTFSSELLASEHEYQAFLDDIRESSVIGRAARIPRLAEVQSQLAPGEALLEYVVADERVMIFVIQPDGLSVVSSELARLNLQSKVKLLRELLQQPTNERWWAPAVSLSETLIEPMQSALPEEVHHLYFVPHGILNYLPFAILPVSGADGSRVLMEKYTITYLPAAAALVRERQNTEVQTSLLALAPGRARLRHSLEEARSIADLYRPRSLLLSGQEATESAFKEKAGSYGILHFSTHGFFNSNNPLFSGLELEEDTGNDGLLEVHEILGLSLDAELVTLSACETGMGSGYFNRIPAGDNFVSLTRAFLMAGSRSVLATLWEVDDRSTVEIMKGFYQRLERGQQGSSQARSLAEIQRELRLSTNYSHPFYWAPFVLVGRQGQAGDDRS